MGLTPRQSEILKYVTEYSQRRGYAPTLQEIGDRFGLSSVATVHKHISHLVEKGYLRRERPAVLLAAKDRAGRIALLARERGYEVGGCDANVYPPMSTQLRKLGIEIHEGLDAQQLDVNPDCVVVGNVMRRGLPVVEAMLDRGLMPLMSHRNRNAVRLVRFQSIAEPLETLAGSWA